MIVVHVPGPPQGKGRPRTRKNGGRPYTPAKTRAYEQLLRLHAVAEMAKPGARKFTGPVVVAVLAAFAIPPSWPKAKQEKARRGTLRPTVKPDFDNISKMVDALNGVVWGDDSAVVEAHFKKIYYPTPSLTIRVWSADDIDAGGGTDLVC